MTAKLTIKKLALLFVSVFVALSVQAQSIADIKINEILVKNESYNRDMFGKTSGWIELHNTGYSRINIGGCYLSLRSQDLGTTPYTQIEGITYRIPTNVPEVTTIPPKGYVMIFADGLSSLGPQYANFVLDGATVVCLSDASGKIILDQMFIDTANIKSNISIGRDVVRYGTDAQILEFVNPTPGVINIEPTAETASDRIVAIDPYGIGMALVAMSIVFCALLILFLIFKRIGIVNQNYERRREEKKNPKPANASANMVSEKIEEASGEEIAAIAVALKHYQQDLERLESNVLTINKVARTYSPWSSKLYGLTQLPNRK